MLSFFVRHPFCLLTGAVAATDPLNNGAGKTFEMFKATTSRKIEAVRFSSNSFGLTASKFSFRPPLAAQARSSVLLSGKFSVALNITV